MPKNTVTEDIEGMLSFFLVINELLHLSFINGILV
jgi:hypothetical protein